MTHDKLPRSKDSLKYEQALQVAKEQIDLVVREQHMPFSWLDELQRYLNRARIEVAEASYNRTRTHYED